MLSLAEKLGVFVTLVAWPWPAIYGALLVFDHCSYEPRCSPYENWLLVAALIAGLALAAALGFAIAKIGKMLERQL